MSNVVTRIPMLIQWRDIRVVSPQVLLGIFGSSIFFNIAGGWGGE